MRFGTEQFTRVLVSTVFAGIAMVAVGNAYALGPYTCNVTEVGYRTDANTLRIACRQGTTFWAYEKSANASCGTKATYDALKMYHSMATSSLLSGKKMTIYYVTQTVCNTTDSVPTEIILQNQWN